MYDILEKIFKEDKGNYIDYPLNFSRTILNMDKEQSYENMYKKYKAELEHKYQTLY